MPCRSALQGVLHVPRGGVLQAELRQRVCLQYGDHDGRDLAFDGDGGGARLVGLVLNTRCQILIRRIKRSLSKPLMEIALWTLFEALTNE